jgi:NadR type nicotinamide-nucleotide adenylyltransferase
VTRAGPAAPRRVPRLVVTGSESAGKTTLAAALARALRSAWVPEFSRAYAERVQRPLTAHDVTPIAQGHLESVTAAEREWRTRFGARTDAPPLVLDTDLVSTVVYARHYYGACPPWIEEAARLTLGDLYLLCAADLPWVADGVRDQPLAREQLHARFAETLQEFGATVAPVRGLGEAREAHAMAAIAAIAQHAR